MIILWPGSSIRQGRCKLIRFYEGDRTELYDLSVDIGEAHDIPSDYPEITNESFDKLNHWLETSGASMPSGDDLQSIESNVKQ
jgi:hypothetical protein